MTRIDIAVGDESFAALELGDREAPLILCLHGFPDHPPSFTRVGEALVAKGYRVVIPWLRGYAPSPLQGPFDVDQLAADVRGMLATLAPSSAHLLGHDWGAMITYAALASETDSGIERACAISVPHPVAFARNLLLDPGQLRRSSYMLRFQPRSADRWVAADDFAFIRQLWRRWSPGFELSEHEWTELRATLEASHPAPLEYYRALLSPVSASLGRLRRLSRRIPVPMLTIFGAEDGCIDARLARGSDRFFSGSHALEVIDGAGHFIHLERPARLAESVARHFG